jgi:hypothetical protein
MQKAYNSHPEAISKAPLRHCEQSEAIYKPINWIASGYAFAMTFPMQTLLYERYEVGHHGEKAIQKVCNKIGK